MGRESTMRDRARRGDSMIVLLCFVTVAAGLCAAMSAVVGARHQLVRASRDGMGALDAAESGLSAARFELATQKDADGGGIGTAKGEIDGGAYEVACTPIDDDHVRLIATGQRGLARRSLESVVLVTDETSSPFFAAAFGDDWVTLGGGTFTDAYDSTVGTYASQATQIGPDGEPYAIAQGDIGSNGTITLNGSGTEVHGAATPGTDGDVIYHGGSTVDGGTAPLEEPIVLPPIDMSPITDPDTGAILASAKDLSQLGVTGNVKITKNGDITIGSGGVVKFPAGAWYVNSIKSVAGGTLAVDGDVKIFLAHSMDMTSGGIMNSSQSALALQIYGLGNSDQFGDEISVNASSGLYAAIYAPNVDFTMAGGGAFYGSVIAKTVKNTGGSAYHYDIALGSVTLPNGEKVAKEITWQHAATPEAAFQGY